MLQEAHPLLQHSVISIDTAKDSSAPFGQAGRLALDDNFVWARNRAKLCLYYKDNFARAREYCPVAFVHPRQLRGSNGRETRRRQSKV